jgi:hypothetical protein
MSIDTPGLGLIEVLPSQNESLAMKPLFPTIEFGLHVSRDIVMSFFCTSKLRICYRAKAS